MVYNNAKKKIETILFETKGLTSIGSASRKSTPTPAMEKESERGEAVRPSCRGE